MTINYHAIYKHIREKRQGKIKMISVTHSDIVVVAAT